jgi:hypothetical protein
MRVKTFENMPEPLTPGTEPCTTHVMKNSTLQPLSGKRQARGIAAHQGNGNPISSICVAPVSNMCSAQADNSSRKLRLRCGCQFPCCALGPYSRKVKTVQWTHVSSCCAISPSRSRNISSYREQRWGAWLLDTLLPSRISLGTDLPRQTLQLISMLKRNETAFGFRSTLHDALPTQQSTRLIWNLRFSQQ